MASDPAPPRRHDALRLAAVVVLTLFSWASAFVGIRAAMDGYEPTPAAALRFVISTLVAAAWLAFSGPQRWPRGRDLLWIIGVTGVGTAVYHVALGAGSKAMGAGAASIVVATAPVFTALIAHAFLRERLGLRGWAGIAVALAGVALVGMRGGGRWEPHPALVLFVVAALMSATIHALMRRYLRDYSTGALTAVSVWASAACLVPLAPDAWRLVAHAPRHSTLALVWLGVVPGALGSLGWAYVLARLPASRAAALLYLVPPLTVLMAWVVLGERPHGMAVAGGALALAGVALVGTERTAS